MSSAETLNRIVRKNKAAKVQQLSEIAALFEMEARVKNQLSELGEFENNLLLQKEPDQEAIRQLPRQFRKEQEKKCEVLLSALSQCKMEIANEGEELSQQKKLRVEELNKIETRINKVQEKVRIQKTSNEVANEVLETEEFLQANYSQESVSG